MAKILNIDALAKPAERALVLAGVEYPVVEMTVDNFIETTKTAQDLQARNASAREQIEETIKMILRFVPSLPREKLSPLSMEQLGTVIAFVQGDYDPDAKQAPATGDSAAKK